MTPLHDALKRYFGYAEFRPHQEEIVRRVLDGEAVLGVLPTGAGKSLCYQLPAMLLPRATVVISPLIALMQDQLDGLPPAVRPSATLINSSVAPDDLDRRLAGIESGAYRLIYAAPERLRQGGFLRLLQRIAPSLIVVDEAHCVSVWGHDFRPDYLFIRKALNALAESGAAPGLLAVTATATPEMRDEIAGQLGRDLRAVSASTFRPNLRLEVVRCPNADEKMRVLEAACRETPGATIVYANSRERCEKLARFLQGAGMPAAFYHAGLDRESRQAAQERFMLGRVPIIVATVAFGMGVDKSNVRLVAHFTLPESVEAYTQEAGRAGRDGRASRCVLLYGPGDKANRVRWMRQEALTLETVRDVYRAIQAEVGSGAGIVSPDELLATVFGRDEPAADTRLRVAISVLERCGLLAREPDAGRDLRITMRPAPRNSRAEIEGLLAARQRHAEARLAAMEAYAEGTGCRHAAIARHFGQALDPCGGACDRCLGTATGPAAAGPAPPDVDRIPDLGAAILGAVAALPFGLGRTGLARVLRGAPDSPVKADRCAAHGILAGLPASAIERVIERLVEDGMLERDPADELRRLGLTAMARAALAEGRPILANTLAADRGSRTGAPGPDGDPAASPGDDEQDRFEQLRAWRRIEAQRAGLPPYVIFHDATLRALARANPAGTDDLVAVPGLGPAKLDRYGAALLALLRGEAPSGDGTLKR